MHGFLAHDKAAGPSSAQAIALLRRGLPGKVRVGHAGTLDPFATGLLLVLLGELPSSGRSSRCPPPSRH
ncbi:MAG: hypothetical protein MUE73_10255 [Planctomycetes bacterium]|nr:hypothetical protein [Planctomycetota bacterium]